MECSEAFLDLFIALICCKPIKPVPITEIFIFLITANYY